MSWVATAYATNGSATVFDNEFHGASMTHVFAVKIGDDCEVYVWVHDNTENGITEDEAREIANEAVKRPIYWSDFRMCHWMLDFQCAGHWVEGLFPNNGLPDDDMFLMQLLRLNVHD